ncbi:hypothetical protein [Roseospira goensis]|uniref:Polysaccharide deacetylase n=1 Tax=Roseospira goensis TaxID=391922 RepID=A0A7W6WLR6_9PROT|nr:hypothetical protein [Roseospira goensis]MBB4287144.1 hypothetical protein [Roseospira goensis]
MTAPPWTLLDDELAAWTDAGRRPVLWWRDDDAVTVTDALDRLSGLSVAHGAPVTLAVIPAEVEPALAPYVAARPTLSVAPHGLTHANHAGPDDGGASEFPASRPLDRRVADAAEGWQRVTDVFGDVVPLPLLVAPFNKVGQDLADALPAAGLSALSVHGPRAAWRNGAADPPVAVVNTHVDLLRWRPEAAFIGADKAVRRLVAALRARRLGRDDDGTAQEPDEPVGLLTHHRVHGDDLWRFLDDLLAHLQPPAVRWAAARHLIAEGTPS